MTNKSSIKKSSIINAHQNKNNCTKKLMLIEILQYLLRWCQYPLFPIRILFQLLFIFYDINSVILGIFSGYFYVIFFLLFFHEKKTKNFFHQKDYSHFHSFTKDCFVWDCWKPMKKNVLVFYLLMDKNNLSKKKKT